MSRLPSLTVLLVLSCMLPTAASADPAEAQAQVLFDQGQKLLDQGKIAEACAAFDASEKAAPAITTLLNQADCRQKNNQLATSWGLFVEAARQTRDATDERDQHFHRVAEDFASKLEPRLSKLTIHVAEDSKIEGLEILRGNEVVEPGAWDQPLPIDGGSYAITARAPSYEPFTAHVMIASEGDTATVEIPKLERAPPPPPHKAVEKKPVVIIQEVSQTNWYWFAGAGAVVLFGSAVALELWGESTLDDAKAEPDSTKRASLWHSANLKRYGAEASAIGGLGCAGLAVWLYLRRDRESPQLAGQPKTVVLPTAAPGFAGIRLEATW